MGTETRPGLPGLGDLSMVNEKKKTRLTKEELAVMERDARIFIRLVTEQFKAFDQPSLLWAMGYATTLLLQGARGAGWSPEMIAQVAMDSSRVAMADDTRVKNTTASVVEQLMGLAQAEKDPSEFS